MADIGVGGRVNSQQEVVDQLQQIHVWRRTEHLLDNFDERQTDFLWDGSQMLIPMLLETNTMGSVSGEINGLLCKRHVSDVPVRPGR